MHAKSCSTGGQGTPALDGEPALVTIQANGEAAHAFHQKQSSQAALNSIANLSEILPDGEDTASDLAQLIDRRTGSLVANGCWASQRKSIQEDASQASSLDLLMETKKNNYFIK